MIHYNHEQLTAILEEVAGFEIDLAEDPTLPNLGTKYLQKIIAICRRYLNRVTFYTQKVSQQVKDLRMQVRQQELDIEFKMAEKLTNDPIVRQQPAVADRQAVATTMLKAEYDALTILRSDLMDAEETLKIIKMKHADLVRTNTDIKSQRQLVKDDMDSQLGGGQGYVKPQVKQDGSVPDGMTPPVMPGTIDPKDLLDPSRKPDDMPEPMDEMHAQQIADFYSSRPIAKSDPTVTPAKTECPECGEPQFVCPSGLTCKNGHGFDNPDVPSKPQPRNSDIPLADDNVSYDDLLT